MEQPQELLKQIDYTFRDPDLLELALTHRSHRKRNNERLEFLGDSILGFVIADILYRRFPDASEGKLTRLRASLVKKETLARIGRDVNIGEHIRLGSGEKKSGGWRRDSIIANTVESVLGAIYADSGFSACYSVIEKIYTPLLENISGTEITKDPKTLLQEYLQSRKMALPMYEVIREEGEFHDRTFTVKCRIQGFNDEITAQGKSKKVAEQKAADKMLEMINVSPGTS